MTPPTRQWGPLPRTPHQPKAKLRAAVKSSPTGPREARREAVPLDGRAQRSYPAQPRPHGPEHWVEKVGRSIKGSDTPHPRGVKFAATGVEIGGHVGHLRGRRWT